MKTQTYLALLLFSLTPLIVPLALQAGSVEDGHHHGPAEKKAGPHGGRLLTAVMPSAEFFLTDEGFVQITFVNEAGEIIPPAEQVVTLMGGDRQAPVQLGFVTDGSRLLSSEALPDQPDMPIILTIRTSPEGPLHREKFYLNLSECGECSYQEYACICGH